MSFCQNKGKSNSLGGESSNDHISLLLREELEAGRLRREIDNHVETGESSNNLSKIGFSHFAVWLGRATNRGSSKDDEYPGPRSDTRSQVTSDSGGQAGGSLVSFVI